MPPPGPPDDPPGPPDDPPGPPDDPLGPPLEPLGGPPDDPPGPPDEPLGGPPDGCATAAAASSRARRRLGGIVLNGCATDWCPIVPKGCPCTEVGGGPWRFQNCKSASWTRRRLVRGGTWRQHGRFESKNRGLRDLRAGRQYLGRTPCTAPNRAAGRVSAPHGASRLRESAKIASLTLEHSCTKVSKATRPPPRASVARAESAAPRERRTRRTRRTDGAVLANSAQAPPPRA